jgi:C1A family cysteine protease
MYVNPTTHPLNTFVLSSSSTSSPTATSPAPTATEEDMVSETLKKLLTVHADYSHYDMSVLPTEFEPQNGVWKEWLVPAVNQGSCGSCWSFASVGALSDRFNVLMRKRFLKDMLSPLMPTICNDILSVLFEDDPQRQETVQNPFRLSASTIENLACHGNSLVTACYYLYSQGTTTNDCMSYTLPYSTLVTYKTTELNWGFPFTNSVYFPRSVGKTIYDYSNFSQDQNKGTCAFYNQSSARPFAYCNDFIRIDSVKNYGSPQQHFQALIMYQVQGVVEDNRRLMMDIFKWGPVCSAFTVYDDFYDFDPKTTPVYVHDPTRTNVVGGHAVEIVGWGVYEGKTPFWWIKNSWGPEYGMQGYFRFLRGKDQCSLESNALSMLPNLFFPLNRVSYLQELETALQQLDIFKVEFTPVYEQFQIKIAKTFEPIAADLISYRQDHVMKQFPLLQYHALSRIGYLTTDVLTPTNYNSAVFRTMPGLYLGTPFSMFPYTRDFVAAEIPTTTKKTRVILMTTWTLVLWVLLVLLIVLVLLVRMV